MKRHLILVGLPGSGKSEVGRLMVERWPADYPDYTDLDESVERAAGCSIPEIFARHGEAGFRRRESEAMEQALARPPHLIAAGAGWIAEPGNLERARVRKALVVYLRVRPETAALRLAHDATRPLLAGAPKLARLRELLAGREAWYERADLVIDAEAPLEAVAAEVGSRVRAGPG